MTILATVMIRTCPARSGYYLGKTRMDL